MVSQLGKEYNVEMFSEEAFLHSSIPNKTLRIFIGLAALKAPGLVSRYDKYGLAYFSGDSCIRLFVDEKKRIQTMIIFFKN